MLHNIYKVKRFDDGFWYVLVSRTHQGWEKISEKGHSTAEEAERVLCKQLDADTSTQREWMNSAEET